MGASLGHRIRAVGGSASRRRSFAVALATAALVSLTAAPTSSASRTQTTIFDIGGDAFSASTAQRLADLDQLKAFGVDTVRIVVSWRDIAPDPGSPNKPSNFTATDPGAYPGFGWGPIDDLVRGAAARGLQVLLTPSGPIPNWGGTSGNSDKFDPFPDEFRQFVQAMGRRYDGTYDPAAFNQGGNGPNPLPRVGFWAVWNEPNLELFLLPQYSGGQPVAGAIYRNLFLAAQQGLAASGHGGDPILIGETSPGPGLGGTPPIDFMRGVFCLNGNFQPVGGCPPISATGWAQHPYDPFDPPFKKGRRGLINPKSLPKLADALAKAARAGATTSNLPIYATEYGVESTPDPIGVSLKKQAQYIGIAEYLMWLNPRVAAFSQYLMKDDKGGAFDFQTGLKFVSGAPKTAFNTFSLSLAAQRKTKKKKKVTIWGHVRPGQGRQKVKVFFKDRGHKKKKLKKKRTDANGYFKFKTPFRKRRTYSATSTVNGQKLKSIQQKVYVFK